ncbi:MAG: hypothetical protein D6795_01005 [Deltaproteobacteria bacterium]|nr:MAG: hypothetical protein D6795_01005 [Deltaproteobacteria bacterium]
MRRERIVLDKTLRSLRKGRRDPAFREALEELHATCYRYLLQQLLPRLDQEAQAVVGEFFLDFLRRRRYLEIPREGEDARRWFFKEVTDFVLDRLRICAS